MVKLPFMLYAFALLASTVAMSLKPKCSEVCPAVYQPVCGSDENTYPNECSLKVADCKSDKNITVIYIGPCVKPKCPEICPAVLMPVCGSDGKTYDNECTLKVADCKSSENITVKHAGPCVKPKCPELCPAVYQPVCGSDGNTYPNECSLKVADCKSDENITVLYLGPCVSTPPLIECGLEVCSYYAMCSEINGTKKCACRLACPLNYSPVCGSDGKTYPNECAMKGESCRQKEWIYKNHDGECMKPKCPENCPRIYDPVCGSDGKTYSNECNLKVADCKSEEDIEVMYIGRCVSTPPLVECGLEICSYYAICSEINGTKKCVCRLACPRIYSPVCGSDGKTYPNECVMKGESCRQKEWIYKNHDGECMKPKCPENCSKIYDPVCASDGKTYSNECNLKVADCKSEEDIEVMYIGPCVSTPPLVECGLEMCSYYAMCLEINGTKKCVCPEVCPLFYSPVCGSDGKTYSNECFMMVESCRQKEWIYKNHDGQCMKPKCREGCPKIYDPVCGSDGKTYSNECVLKVADCKSEEKIEVIYIGSCEPF